MPRTAHVGILRLFLAVLCTLATAAAAALPQSTANGADFRSPLVPRDGECPETHRKGGQVRYCRVKYRIAFSEIKMRVIGRWDEEELKRKVTGAATQLLEAPTLTKTWYDEGCDSTYIQFNIAIQTSGLQVDNIIQDAFRASGYGYCTNDANPFTP